MYDILIEQSCMHIKAVITANTKSTAGILTIISSETKHISDAIPIQLCRSEQTVRTDTEEKWYIPCEYLS